MDRRGFLKMLGIAAGGVALDAAIPLGRVWSFPKNIVIAAPRAVGNQFVDVVWFNKEVLRYLQANMVALRWDKPFMPDFPIGGTIKVRYADYSGLPPG